MVCWPKVNHPFGSFCWHFLFSFHFSGRTLLPETWIAPYHVRRVECAELSLGTANWLPYLPAMSLPFVFLPKPALRCYKYRSVPPCTLSLLVMSFLHTAYFTAWECFLSGWPLSVTLWFPQDNFSCWYIMYLIIIAPFFMLPPYWNGVNWWIHLL